MIIKQKLGKLHDFPVNGRFIDRVVLEWYETNKRILHKRSSAGKDIALKFMKENPGFLQDDVVYEDADSVVVIEIQACDVILVRTHGFYEAASLCYEIGNKHLPLFYEQETFFIPYDVPLYRWLSASGYAPELQKRKLLHPLKTTVAAHGVESGSLFSKILQMTTATNGE